MVPLWTTESLQSNMQLHVDQLSHIAQRVLRTSHDPLMLVLQEAWHERLDRVSALASALFEQGVTPSLYFARPSVCWALSIGKPTAVVLDCGHAQTTVAAVCDAYVCRRSITTSPVAGAAVSAELSRHVAMSYEQTLPAKVLAGATETQQRLSVQLGLLELKELWGAVGLGYVGKASSSATNAALALEPAANRFIAPDGSELHLSPTAADAGLDVASVRESIFEVLFRDPPTSSVGPPTTVSVPKMIVKARRNIDIDLQAVNLAHILCGGTSQAPRFANRIATELKGLDAAYFKAAPPIVSPVAGAWRGASMSAEATGFLPLWISKAEFAEEGDSVLRRKLCY